MDLKIKDKLAFVSGSTKGIGYAIAVGLAREGVQVVINGRSQQSVDQATEALRATVPDANVQGFAGDVSEAAQVAKLVERFPHVDILVNNMGIFDPKPFEEITNEEWQRFFNVNVLSGVQLSRAYLPGMKQKNWGRVVFISSESGIQIPIEMIHYGLTKTAQLALSRGLAETCVGTAVTVNSVLPGPTSSDGVEEFVHKLSGGESFESFEKKFFEDARPTSILKRFTSPEEIANMVVYVCSELSSATNGAALRADGGVVRAAF